MYELIKKYEGCRLQAYKCPAGVWTIGYGTTVYPDGSPVKKGNMITQEKAEALLTDYICRNILPRLEDLRITENQKDAICSLVYNIGWGAFSRSKCYKAIKEKDWNTAFKNWDWVSAGGKTLNGLIKRRAEEMGLFFADI